jgi:hypothetical protein
MSMAWLRQRPARVPTWVIDAGWAVAVAVAVTIAIRAAREPGARRPDLLAYALGLTLGALLLARRRWPVAVLVASFAALQLYYVFNYPGISAAVPLGVALYTAGAAGYARWALLVVAWFVAGPLIFRLLVDPEPVLPVLSEVVRELSLWLAILLLGDAVRNRRTLTLQQRLLEAERARSERLLRDMLPEAIAERLKQQEEGVIADAFPLVTVLFADIVDFTSHAERSPPEATVALLNDLFSQFDGLTEARGLEKIKTVGDAYMVAGGLPDPRPDHPVAVAELALGMLELAARRSLPDGGPVRLRIGIASGPGSSAGGGSAMTCGVTR